MTIPFSTIIGPLLLSIIFGLLLFLFIGVFLLGDNPSDTACNVLLVITQLISAVIVLSYKGVIIWQ